MAPTSTTKKSTTSKSKASSSSSSSAATKTKRTVVKSASSTSTAKKKIIKVQRKPKTTTTTNNNKKKQPPKSKSKTKSNINPAIILSKNLPVTSKPPILPTNASALRPGSLLQQICNGRDIQLSRSAVVTPNIEKEKGKYLLIFPGMFSFNNSNNTTTTTTTTKKAAAATKEEEEEREVESDDGDLKSKSVNNDNDDDDDCDEDEDVDDSPLKETTTKNRKISATIATTPTQIHSLGRIEGLRTDIPTFKIPFPNIQKDLIFPGKKVQTTSKYLIMSCSNKKNGTVQCKVRSIILYIYYTVLYCTTLLYAFLLNKIFLVSILVLTTIHDIILSFHNNMYMCVYIFNVVGM